jgi:hypothetical protein
MKERSLLTLNENFRLNPHALAVCCPLRDLCPFVGLISTNLLARSSCPCVPCTCSDRWLGSQANMITGKPNVDPARTGEKIETSSEIIGLKTAHPHTLIPRPGFFWDRQFVSSVAQILT